MSEHKQTDLFYNSAQSKGGTERAKKLTSERKKEIASKAAATRWNKPRALHYGELNLLEKKITCAVLNDERRVISHRSLALALGTRGGGRYWEKKKEIEASGGVVLPEYVSASYLSTYIDDKTKEALLKPINYLTQRGEHAQGFEATILPKICDIWIRAQKDGALKSPSQILTAEKAYDLLKGFSEIGIIALIDEVTGYQNVRNNNALQKILDKYLTDHRRVWSKTFPDVFWENLLRTKGYENFIGMKRPQFVGHWVNDLVYDRLAPGIRKKLQELNPKNSKGNRKARHHQFLTEDHGVPELKEHIIKLNTLMEASGFDSKLFEQMVNKVARKRGDDLELDLDGLETR